MFIVGKHDTFFRYTADAHNAEMHTNVSGACYTATVVFIWDNICVNMFVILLILTSE